MTDEAHQRKNTLRWFTNGDSFQTFNQQWAISPRGISCYLVPYFTPSMAQFVHDNTISKEVFGCLYCNVDPLPISLVLSCLIKSICHIQYMYNHTSYIHTFIHSYINTFICSYIHTFMRTKHIHSINLHMVALVTQSLDRLHPSISILTYHVSSGQS